MKYLLITKHKTAYIETDSLGIIVNGGDSFKHMIGKTLKDICELYHNKRFPVRLEKKDEYTTVA